MERRIYASDSSNNIEALVSLALNIQLALEHSENLILFFDKPLEAENFLLNRNPRISYGRYKEMIPISALTEVLNQRGYILNYEFSSREPREILLKVKDKRKG